MSDGRCQGKNQFGERCRRIPKTGEAFCLHHSPAPLPLPEAPAMTVQSIEAWLRGLLHHADTKLLVWVAVACFEHSPAVREEFLKLLTTRAAVADEQEEQAARRRAAARETEAARFQPTSAPVEPKQPVPDDEDDGDVFELPHVEVRDDDQ